MRAKAEEDIMSRCDKCGTSFSFMDALKTLNPANIKCSGCDNRIKSIYFVFAFAIILFALATTLFWFSPWSGPNITGAPMLVFLGVLGLVFEYGYFFILDNGLIKSNLIR